MFRFKEITLNGWDLWPAVRIPLDRDVILVTGPNGSGKTTLLDAIRQLLHAPRLSSKRRLQHYLKNPRQPSLISAVVSNEQTESAPLPFARSRITTSEVTLACALLPAAGGSPDKRFAILPGRKTIQELQTILLNTRDWMGPDDYGRALESAGVTRSLMKVLAIEQGRTNDLFNLKPKELFRQVIDMMGRRDVLDRYREARRIYDDSGVEVSRQTIELQGLQARLNTIDRQVQQLNEWEELRDKVDELEHKIPAALYQQEFRKSQQAETKLPEVRNRLRSHEAEKARQDLELENWERKVGLATDALELARTEEDTANIALQNTLRTQSMYEERVRALVEKKDEADTIPVGDLESFESSAVEARRTEAQAEIEAKQLATELETLRVDLESLEAGLPVYPKSVRRVRRSLDEVGIEHELACELMEVADHATAAAVEAALDDARYALLVSKKDTATVIDLAQRHDFPGPVYCGDRLETPVSAGALELYAGVPAWIPEYLERLSVGENGCWTDERGTWVKSAGQRLIGNSGRQAELERVRNKFARMERKVEGATRRAAETRTRTRAIEKQLSEEQRRQQLLAEIEALPEVRTNLSDSQRVLAAHKMRFDKAQSKRSTAEDNLRKAELQLHGYRNNIERTISLIKSDKKSILEIEETIHLARATLADLESEFSSELKGAAERDELDGPDTVRSDRDRAHLKFKEAGDPPPSEVREEARNLRANIEELERHLERRRIEANAARDELGECRRRYLDIVEAALGDYRERAKNLARRADVSIEMDIPRLENEDRSIDEAGISVRMGFDDKERLPLGDPSFSGGQQVIAGMVLLMAMAETDGQGFFILDEPFAHLSLDRVDDVGKFLKAARAQFILTAPTTLDREQLDPASLVIVLQKRRTRESNAPVPVVAVA